MADTYKSIVDLDVVTSIDGTDYIVTNDSGAIKQISKTNLLSDVTDSMDALEDLVGDLTSLETTEQTDLVSSINEVVDNVGDLSDLTTDTQTTIVAAINEIEAGNIDTDTTLSVSGQPADGLITGNKIESLEDAVETLNTEVGDLTSLETSTQTDLVSAINEVNTNADTNTTNISTNTTNIATNTTDIATNTSDISDLDTRVTTLEGGTITTDTTLSVSGMPADAKAVGDKAQELLAGVVDIRAYLGMIETEDTLGLCVDYENKTFTRLASAADLSAGTDFDAFEMYSGRKKVIVADDGTIVAEYGDSNYVEDGSIGQVMVYQPKFYYLVSPLEYDPIDTGIGYHLRKANYYITANERTGFKLHPAFYDESGNEVDYILIGAYEGSLYDTSASTYITDDSQVMDASEDLFCSIAGARPASGLTQSLTRPNIETMCNNRGTGFHSLGIKAMSAEQMLMMIELGTFNFQSAIGNGVTSITDSSSYSCASYTGSTASLGNGTGTASSTNDYTGTAQTDNGKTSICYRGVENHWGNIWKFVDGVNIWGNGSMGGGQPYICEDFNYAESKNSDNYEGAGFTVANANGYVNAMGYSTEYDWLFMPSEVGGNSSLPVGDYTYIASNLNAYRIARLGGTWDNGLFAGGFCWFLTAGVGGSYRYIGGRLVYVPTANV